VLVPSVEYYKDPFQNLADRVTLGGGLGYDINRLYGLLCFGLFWGKKAA
jgi:hypothetical protein